MNTIKNKKQQQQQPNTPSVYMYTVCLPRISWSEVCLLQLIA